LLGQGGMGAVYLAADLHLDKRRVAIKEMGFSQIRPHEKSAAIAAFQGEAMLLASLSHPNLPRVYDHFHHDGRWYLVMDYIEGETLHHYFYKTMNGELPLEEILNIGIQLSFALDYLHTRQPPIIFRDLKPLNIMRTPVGHLYLIDFGIARHFKIGQAHDTHRFGTPGYVAPEIYRQQSSPASDIYSLGATLYELLTAQSPPLLTSLRSQYPDIPIELEQLIMQMLENDPDRRPASAASIHHLLHEIQAVCIVSRHHADSERKIGIRSFIQGRYHVEKHPVILRIEHGKNAGTDYMLNDDLTYIGRDRKNHIFLEDLAVSRHHAIIQSQGNGNYTIVDNDSANGTRVNGHRLESHQPFSLKHNDRIKIGRTVFIFKKS